MSTAIDYKYRYHDDRYQDKLEKKNTRQYKIIENYNKNRSTKSYLIKKLISKILEFFK
jgi:hypothetical protein